MASLDYFQPTPFFNRVNELSALTRSWHAKAPVGQLTLLYGRRRLGKTYLLQRFFAGAPGDIPKPHCYYLADQTTAASQRLQFAEQVLSGLPEEGVTSADLAVSWNSIFRHIAARSRAEFSPSKRFGLILDEFPYLVAQSPELPSILQSWWDREGIHSPLLLVLCGSQLSAMESLGAESAPLFGRFTGGIFRLPPLRYDEVASFYANHPAYRDLASILIMYGVLGGTPRYHAQVDTDRPYGEEIVDLLLRPRATLEGEIRFLLGSEQIRDPSPYNAVLSAIANGATQFGDILGASGTERGVLSFYLRTLTDLGWIRREFPFGETSEKRALYQVTDPFMAFWYRFVQPLGSALSFSDPMSIFDTRIMPFLSDYMGRYVFESICQQWLEKNAQTILNLEIDRAGRWWSRDGQVEIDLMARLRGGSYLFGECKWSSQAPIGMNVYTKLLSKIEHLPDARWRTDAKTVLFSVGGFTEDLKQLASRPENNLQLVGPELFLPGNVSVQAISTESYERSAESS